MAKLVDVGTIGSYFESLSDPRHERNRKHLGRVLFSLYRGKAEPFF